MADPKFWATPRLDQFSPELLVTTAMLARVTTLAALNVAEQQSIDDPHNPIQSVCALQDADCANPMWLGGYLSHGEAEPRASMRPAIRAIALTLTGSPPDHLIYAGVTKAIEQVDSIWVVATTALRREA